MKFLCDVHISYSLVKFLNDNGHEAIHVNSILDKWFTLDSEICKYADLHDFILITKDVDFRNLHFVKGTPKKLIRVCLGNISNDELRLIFKENIEALSRRLVNSKFYVEVRNGFINIIDI